MNSPIGKWVKDRNRQFGEGKLQMVGKHPCLHHFSSGTCPHCFLTVKQNGRLQERSSTAMVHENTCASHIFRFFTVCSISYRRVCFWHRRCNVLRYATIFCSGLGEESTWCSVIQSQWKGLQKEWERRLERTPTLPNFRDWLDWVWPLFSGGLQMGHLDLLSLGTTLSACA